MGGLTVVLLVQLQHKTVARWIRSESDGCHPVFVSVQCFRPLQSL